jgi:hypothetical protein
MSNSRIQLVGLVQMTRPTSSSAWCGPPELARSAVNYTAEHYKPLFWRRLATTLSPLLVPQLCPMFWRMHGSNPI